MSLSRLEMTSPSTVNLQTWGVDFYGTRSAWAQTHTASSGEAHFHTPLE